jgi:hypothetical protein
MPAPRLFVPLDDATRVSSTRPRLLGAVIQERNRMFGTIDQEIS